MTSFIKGPVVRSTIDEMADRPRPPDRAVQSITLGGIILLGVVLGLFRLGEKSFWWDEIYSLYFSSQDWPAFLRVLSKAEANASLHYMILRFWLRVGDTEVIVRGLSVVWAVATLPIVYALGVRLFGKSEAAISAFLLSINAFFIMYAQEARSYSLVLFLTALSFWLFVECMQRSSPSRWAAYAIASTLAAYAHNFGALALPAQWVSLMFLRQRHIPWRPLVASTAVVGLLLVPLAAMNLSVGVEHILSRARPGFSALIGVFSALTGEGGKPLLLLYMSSCLITLQEAVKRWSVAKASLDVWRYGVLMAWLFVPIGIALAASYLLVPVFLPRFFIICLPALTLIASSGIVQLRPRWVQAGLVSLIVGLSLNATFSYYTSSQKEEWREATRYILSNAKPNDAILFHGSGGWRAFHYYQSKSKENPGEKIYLLTELPESPSQYYRFWLVLSHDQGGDRLASRGRIQASLAKHFSRVEEHKFYGIRVLLYIDPAKSQHLRTVAHIHKPGQTQKHVVGVSSGEL